MRCRKQHHQHDNDEDRPFHILIPQNQNAMRPHIDNLIAILLFPFLLSVFASLRAPSASHILGKTASC